MPIWTAPSTVDITSRWQALLPLVVFLTLGFGICLLAYWANMLEGTFGFRTSGDYVIGISAVFLLTTVAAVVLAICSASRLRIWTDYLPFVAVFVSCFVMLMIGGALMDEIVHHAYHPEYSIGLAGLLHEVSKLIVRDGLVMCIPPLLGTLGIYVANWLVARRIAAKEK